MFDNSDGHQLFTVVATVHHQRIDQSFDNWALSLSESLDLVTARGVWEELLCVSIFIDYYIYILYKHIIIVCDRYETNLSISVLAGQVISQGDVGDLIYTC